MSEPGFDYLPQQCGTVLEILVVERHPASRLMLGLQLTRMGHRVTVAVNGQQALQVCLKTPFDVVFTGLSLPGLDSCRLVRALRLHERRRQLYPSLVLGITARRFATNTDRWLAAGMDRCLAKPLTVNQLQSLLPGGEDCVADQPALDMTELERLAAGNPLVLGELVQVLVETTEGDLRSLRQCALDLDLPGLHLLAHRIKGGVRMVNAQELVAACQAMEDRCLAPQPATSALADDLRRLGLEVLRLLLGLRRYKASRLISAPAATGSAIPPAPRR